MNKIIVLTHSKMRAKIVKNYLSRVTNNTIYWSKSTKEVKKILSEEEISLILSDVDLKGQTVFDFAKGDLGAEVVAMVDEKNWQELKSWFEHSNLPAVKFPFSSIELLESLNRNFDRVNL